MNFLFTPGNVNNYRSALIFYGARNLLLRHFSNGGIGTPHRNRGCLKARHHRHDLRLCKHCKTNCTSLSLPLPLPLPLFPSFCSRSLSTSDDRGALRNRQRESRRHSKIPRRGRVHLARAAQAREIVGGVAVAHAAPLRHGSVEDLHTLGLVICDDTGHQVVESL